ncbi:MAG TPA: CpsB/CapC family capsule biosynthesis tyrosine phosphatase [Solirubrobacteraceae bacterium]
MIDLHIHVLAAIDDGPRSIDGSLEMARSAVEAGLDTIVATPHVSSRYTNDAETIAGGVAELSERLREEQIPLKLLAGAEVAITHMAEMEPAEIAPLGLGGGEWVLAEPPFTAVITGLEGAIEDLHSAGHRVLLAHPERCPAFHRDPERLTALVRSGVLTSLTSGSLVGQFGQHVRRLALHLLDAGLVHNVASDAHDCVKRPPSIAKELRASGRAGLSDWLSEEVPRAILDGAEIPPRPSATGSRGSRWTWPRRRR